MTRRESPKRLTPQERAAMVAGMQQSPAAPAAASQPPSAWREADLSFATLPGMDVVALYRTAAGIAEIGDPFYRLHEARAGASSRIDGKPVINFASYDYLGLNGDPRIVARVAEAAVEWGTSVSASRLTAGERPFHRALERNLAAHYQAEDALVFVGGHATNVSTLTALMGPEDLILYDALSHNSIVVGAETARAVRRAFPHNDLAALDQLLAKLRPRHKRCLIVSEGLFSMDGDGPDLAGLVALKEKWGAWLMIDEAHALGVLGETGQGIAQHWGVDPKRVDIWMGTLSKTLVSCGGYIAGAADLVTFLKFHATGMVYSVGMPAPAAVAADTALGLMKAEPERVLKLQRNGRHFRAAAAAAGFDVGMSWGYSVTSIIIGDSLRTVLLAQALLRRGINVFPVIPPGVPEKSARLRFFLASEHRIEDLDTTVAAVREELDALKAAGLSVAGIAAMMK